MRVAKDEIQHVEEQGTRHTNTRELGERGKTRTAHKLCNILGPINRSIDQSINGMERDGQPIATQVTVTGRELTHNGSHGTRGVNGWIAKRARCQRKHARRNQGAFTHRDKARNTQTTSSNRGETTPTRCKNECVVDRDLSETRRGGMR